MCSSLVQVGVSSQDVNRIKMEARCLLGTESRRSDVTRSIDKHVRCLCWLEPDLDSTRSDRAPAVAALRNKPQLTRRSRSAFNPATSPQTLRPDEIWVSRNMDARVVVCCSLWIVVVVAIREPSSGDYVTILLYMIVYCIACMSN